MKKNIQTSLHATRDKGNYMHLYFARAGSQKIQANKKQSTRDNTISAATVCIHTAIMTIRQAQNCSSVLWSTYRTTWTQ